MRTVKHILMTLSRRLSCSRLQVALLDATGAGQAAHGQVVVELLSAADSGPPEWVRFLAAGPNKARDGRGTYTVADPARVVQLTNEYKGSIDLLLDFEHQFDRSRLNGQPAPAAAWIKELSAKGPDGTPGVWARIDWLPDTVELIKARKYRYLSAAIAHDDKNVVQFVPRASLTNQPAVDTATALFSAHPNQETNVNLLQKLLAALGLAATTTEDAALAAAKGLATLAAALAKSLGVEVTALSAMTADQVATALQKPLADKIATLSTAAKLGADATPDAIIAGIRGLGADPAQYVARSVYDDVATRLATLTAEATSRLIEEATKAGKLTPAPAMQSWAKTLTHEQLTAFLATAPVIVTGGSGGGRPPGELTVETLSAEDRAEAAKHGVTPEAWVDAKKAETAEAARLKGQLGH